LQIVHDLDRKVLRLPLEERGEIFEVWLVMERQDAVGATCFDHT
jgi:hypothetical protein